MLQAAELKTEYMSEPLGLDVLRPRFFWKPRGDGKRQTAWRVQATDENGMRCWDSGKVYGSAFTQIAYGGRPLTSRDRISWRVKLWDETDTEGRWSENAHFEMGLLERSDWLAEWICAPRKPRKQRTAADGFLREFRLQALPEKARFYIAACGICEAYLNGKRIGEDRLSPGWTDYGSRVVYRTYDVLRYLKRGTNRLEIILGGGVYSGSCGAKGKKRFYGKTPMVLAQLECSEQLGGRIFLGTDTAFRWSCDGPVLRQDVFGGESIDCKREFSYGGDAAVTKCAAALVSANAPPVRDRERLRPVPVKTPSGKVLLDFGKYLTGQLECVLRGDEGSRVTLRFGRTLDERGELSTDADRGRSGCVLRLRLSGWEDTVRQTWSVAGFRYLSVEGIRPEPTAFTACALASDLERTGFFECSDERLNRLMSMTDNTLEACFTDVPALFGPRGMTAPAAGALAAAETSLYLRSAVPFWQKWLRDLTDGQLRDGLYPDRAPVTEELRAEFFAGSAGSAEAGILIPWLCWKLWGDDALVARQYVSLRRCAYALLRQTARSGILRRLFGDAWEQYLADHGRHFAAPGVPEEEEPRRIPGRCSERATAWFVRMCRCMLEMAELMEKEKDVRIFREVLSGAQKAYGHRFGRFPKNAGPDELARRLLTGTLRGNEETACVHALVRAVREREYRMACGSDTAGALPELLSRYGYSEDAYRLLQNTASTGWLTMAGGSATTVWNSWSGTDYEGRFRGVPAALDLCQAGTWLISRCGGIRLAGENHFVLSPTPGGGLAWANCRLESVYGTVRVSWSVRPGGWAFDVSVPPCTTAELHLPDGSVRELEAGKYFFGI